jgi:hypothetical protein
MTNFRRIWAVLSLTGAALLAACGGGGSSTSASGTTGTLRVSLTDAPACGFDQVNVTIQKVQVNQSASASDSDPGWIDIALNPALRVDLLTLSNGVLAELGQVPWPRATTARCGWCWPRTAAVIRWPTRWCPPGAASSR